MKVEHADEEKAEPVEQPPHVLGGVDCSCGFYAYFNGRNDWGFEDGRVTALVEGYGVCTVGSAGFRTSKARLVALIEPMTSVPWLQIKRLYPDVPTFEDEDAAMAAFPLTTSELPSPDDEDFWTRSAS